MEIEIVLATSGFPHADDVPRTSPVVCKGLLRHSSVIDKET